jgi:hypothetical protein
MKHVGKKIVIGLLIMSLTIVSPLSGFIGNVTNGGGSVRVQAATTYPTAWQALPTYTYYTSQKAQKAGKTVLAATIVLLFAGKLEVSTFATALSSALLNQYFVNSDTQDVYYVVTYEYRQLSAGTIDPGSGNHLGDFQIRRTIASYADAAMTEHIYSVIQLKNSTVLYAW